MQRNQNQILLVSLLFVLISCNLYRYNSNPDIQTRRRLYNGRYFGPYLNRVAFPLGGMGAGMICLEGTGAISHVSVRNKMDFFHEPYCYAALCIKGKKNSAKILEGPVPNRKIFGPAGTGRGAAESCYGLPRFEEAMFLARFPFGMIHLKDKEVPLQVQINGWSPFIPGNPDASSLPVAALEYTFTNNTPSTIEAVFSYNAKNFMQIATYRNFSQKGISKIVSIDNGFVLWQDGTKGNPQYEGGYALCIDDDKVVVDHCWFKGGWWDAVTLAWRNIQYGKVVDNPPQEGFCPGASLCIPIKLNPKQEKVIRLMIAWYVPYTNIKHGKADDTRIGNTHFDTSQYYKPWYTSRFKDIYEVVQYWKENYRDLREKSLVFKEAFYDSNLPPEIIEAVAANLTILKTPTVLRQFDGRLWCYEGCNDNAGSCFGSCTHVWNYAQAIPHLFPSLERSLRETEFNENQDDKGNQRFRSNLPITPVHPDLHKWHAAADGQLGGVMKVYREWRISGDTEWLRRIWPEVKQSMDYCISTWDPREKGFLEEPHHNTYDIEYWGPESHCSSFYLGALTAAIEIGQFLGDDIAKYQQLLKKGKAYFESELFNGEYFYQKIQTSGLNATFKSVHEDKSGPGYRESIKVINEQGPKYQYGSGCLSDGVLGFWIAHMCGLDGNIVERAKIRSHVKAVYRYNLKHDLFDHVNPQRSSYALGNEGGLLLCTWPNGGEPLIPFVYSNEVWTGIEYQVASHLMLEGMVEEGLKIVRTCRARYDGRVRNPFDEYECGHWYARAMSSYGLLQGLTGLRYDAVNKTLYIDSKIGNNFRCFISTETGFGTAGLQRGNPYINIKMGDIVIARCIVSGKEMDIYINKSD